MSVVHQYEALHIRLAFSDPMTVQAIQGSGRLQQSQHSIFEATEKQNVTGKDVSTKLSWPRDCVMQASTIRGLRLRIDVLDVSFRSSKRYP